VHAPIALYVCGNSGSHSDRIRALCEASSLIASALYVKLPAYQAIGLTLFGACFLGLLGFGWYIKVEEGKRDHPH